MLSFHESENARARAGVKAVLTSAPPATGSGAVNFGAENVCPSGKTTPVPCSKTLTLAFNVTESGTLGTPKALTTGAPDQDYKVASGTTCTGIVTQGNTCKVNVAFAPIAPGARNGAVEIVDASGNVLANTYIFGTGVGPAIAFNTPPPVTVGTWAFGIAVDASGNIFLADPFDDVVKEILAVDGSIPKNPTVRILAKGLNSPTGVALDGSGNIFVADNANGALKEILARAE